MRRFRLIKYDEAYEHLDLGKVYDGDFLPNNWSETIEETAKRFPNEWEEVFDTNFVKGKPFTDIPKVETKSKTLHKDTDLGYFAGLAMQGYISAGSNGMPNPDMIAQYAMEAAKELIKQLDAESK